MTSPKKFIKSLKAINKTKVLKFSLSVLFVVLAAALGALATKAFLLVHNIPPGGFTGFSNLIHHVLLPGVPIGTIMIMLNVPLYLAAIKIIGNRFGVLSIIGTLSYSLAFDILPQLDVKTEPLLGVLYGGAMVGVCFGIILRAGGSTGGTDMLSYVINHYRPGFSVGIILFSVDGIVITLSGLYFGWESALYAFLSMFLAAKIVDYILEGGKMSRAFYVISPKSEQIAQAVFGKLQRGVTALRGVGMYTKKDKEVLICIVLRTQAALLKQVIYEVDPHAFVFTSNVQEVYGEGFAKLDRIRADKRKEQDFIEMKTAAAEPTDSPPETPAEQETSALVE